MISEKRLTTLLRMVVRYDCKFALRFIMNSSIASEMPKAGYRSSIVFAISIIFEVYSGRLEVRVRNCDTVSGITRKKSKIKKISRAKNIIETEVFQERPRLLR